MTKGWGILTLSIIWLLSGCATQKTVDYPMSSPFAGISIMNSDELKERIKESEIGFDYMLGRDLYHLTMVSKKSRIEGSMILDKQLLAKANIDINSYARFFEKVSSFIDENTKTDPNPSPNCKNPFKVFVKIGKNTKTTQGCRSTDQDKKSKLSRLIKDGEFLIYSKH